MLHVLNVLTVQYCSGRRREKGEPNWRTTISTKIWVSILWNIKYFRCKHHRVSFFFSMMSTQSASMTHTNFRVFSSIVKVCVYKLICWVWMSFLTVKCFRFWIQWKRRRHLQSLQLEPEASPSVLSALLEERTKMKEISHPRVLNLLNQMLNLDFSLKCKVSFNCRAIKWELIMQQVSSCKELHGVHLL